MPPKINFYFRHQSSEKGRYALLIKYYNALKLETELSRSEFVLSALEAYWNAFAMEWGGKPKPSVRKAAFNCIYRLELHIQYLREYFGLEEITHNSVFSASQFQASPLPSNQSDPERKNYLTQEKEVEEEELDLNYEADLTADDQLIDSIF
jgi:hypothetical protein